MTTKKKTLTPGELHFAVCAAQHLAQMTRRPFSNHRSAMAEIRRTVARGEKILAAAGLDNYGHPLGETLSADEQAERLIDTIPGLPKRGFSLHSADGMATLDQYVEHLTKWPEWARRAPGIAETARRRLPEALRGICEDPWFGWPLIRRNEWTLLSVAQDEAFQLEAVGVTPAMLTPLVMHVLAIPVGQRDTAQELVRTVLRRAAGKSL